MMLTEDLIQALQTGGVTGAPAVVIDQDTGETYTIREVVTEYHDGGHITVWLKSEAN